MTDRLPNSWEPDPRHAGKHWQDMFRTPQRDGKPPGQPAAPASSADDGGDEEMAAPDLTEYRPWIVQRVRSRPALMLELRRYEPRSGLWQGWAMPYHNLHAVEYVGDKLVTLDFGARQFAIEGTGLDELARHIQQGTVLSIIEHQVALWPYPIEDSVVKNIIRM